MRKGEKKREDTERYIQPACGSKGQRRCEWKRTLEGCERRMGCIDGRPRCIFRLLIIRNFSTRCDSEKSSGEKSEKQETVVHQCPL